MEFYDKVDSMYSNMIKRSMYLWRIKLELLDHYENTIMCIEEDIDYGNAGTITCNNTQGTRKSCSITLINVDLKYIPTEDSPFWFNRKFRIYLGLVNNRNYKQGDDKVRWTNETDTYWFSKGVYITQDIHVDSIAHTVSISGVDKFAQLDGTLNVLQADEMNTVFEYGSEIQKVITDILMLDMGNGQPLDPIEPLIDRFNLNSMHLYKEFTLSAGQYYGDFLNELATSYGAEVYYDNMGRLIFRRFMADDFPYWVGFRAASQEFKYHLAGYQNPQESIKLTGVNKIIVSTDNVETPNASYTAKNTNPRSPLCYTKIGARTLPENGGVVIINAGNIVDEDSQETDPTLKGESEELVKKRCRDYAEYRLMQETCLSTSISFNCPPYLHLNEGDVVVISDPDFALDCDLYIINSITFPLGADSIQLEVSNLGFLNSDISSLNQYSPLTTQPIKFGIHYITGEVTGTPPPNQSIEIGDNFTTATDYNDETHEVSFARAGYELMNWKDNIHGNYYEPDTEYPMPHQYFTLMANWASVEDYTLEVRVKEVAGAGYSYTFLPMTNQDSTVFSTSTLEVNNKKYYYWGRNFTTQSSIPIVVETNLVIKYCCVPIEQDTDFILNSNLSSLMSSGTNGGKSYYLRYPNTIETLSCGLYSLNSNFETIILPSKCNTLNLTSPFDRPALKEVQFNNSNELVVNYGESAGSNVGSMLDNCGNLQTVTANNRMVINLFESGKFLTWNNVTAPTSLPNVDFAGGICIDNSDYSFAHAFQVEVANSIQRTINIGRSENVDIYKGGLELYNIMAFGNTPISYFTSSNLIFDSIYADHSYLFYLASVGNIALNGNIKIYNDSNLFYNTTFANSSLELNGDNLYIDASDVLTSVSSLSEIIINSDCYIRQSTGINHSVHFIMTCSALTTVKFYGKVDIDCNGLSSIIMTGNGDLTDIYFYDDDFLISNDSNAAIFLGNNSNFKLHGIADGNVQAYAVAHNIAFEVITDV